MADDQSVKNATSTQEAIEDAKQVVFPEGAIRVLDKGFVKLVDHMGDDASIVQSARVSYGDGTKTPSEDETLIRYLMRHRHTTPFEMVEFKFHCRMPIFVARQWVRHRTASINEVSGRYSEMPDLFYEPEAAVCTTQSDNNKQGGSKESLDEADKLAESFSSFQKEAYDHYRNFLQMNMRRELARVNLPISLYTEWYWKIDLHNLLHFLELRISGHAQYEIRVFAEAMAALIKPLVPLTWQAFEDYRLHSCSFSGPEMRALGVLLSGGTLEEEALKEMIPNARERREFLGKINSNT